MMTASLQHALRAAGTAVACAFVTTLAWGQAVTLTPKPHRPERRSHFDH